MSKSLKELYQKKKAMNPAVRVRFSNVPSALERFVRLKGHLPLSVIKSFSDNTGKPIQTVFPKRKTTLFNVKPR